MTFQDALVEALIAEGISRDSAIKRCTAVANLPAMQAVGSQPVSEITVESLRASIRESKAQGRFVENPHLA